MRTSLSMRNMRTSSESIATCLLAALVGCQSSGSPVGSQCSSTSTCGVNEFCDSAQHCAGATGATCDSAGCTCPSGQPAVDTGDGLACAPTKVDAGAVDAGKSPTRAPPMQATMRVLRMRALLTGVMRGPPILYPEPLRYKRDVHEYAGLR